MRLREAHDGTAAACLLPEGGPSAHRIRGAGARSVAALLPAGHCFHAGRICRSRRPPRQRRRPLEAPGTCGAEGRKAGRGRRVWRRNACMRVQHLPSIRSARDLIALASHPSRVGLPLRVLLKAAQSSSISASSVACVAAWRQAEATWSGAQGTDTLLRPRQKQRVSLLFATRSRLRKLEARASDAASVTRLSTRVFLGLPITAHACVPFGSV